MEAAFVGCSTGPPSGVLSACRCKARRLNTPGEIFACKDVFSRLGGSSLNVGNTTDRRDVCLVRSGNANQAEDACFSLNSLNTSIERAGP